MFKFIHSADIHLDSPLRGLTRFDGAPVERIQSATREAFRNLIQLAIDESVAFVLIAGDLWDRTSDDASQNLFFIQQVSRLAKAGILVFIVNGNHDSHSQLTTAIRHWPANVTMIDHRNPQTVMLSQWEVAIHGQSYSHKQVTENLAATFPPPRPNFFNIGLLHTCLDETATNYAPASIDSLVKLGYHYWALGHTHRRQDLSRDGVHIEFPGNIQGRSMRESGPKGCSLVTVAEDFTVTSQFEPLHVVRWEELTIQADDAELEFSVRKTLKEATEAGANLLAARLHIVGNIVNGQDLRDRLDALAVEIGNVWLERILITPKRSVESAPISDLPSQRLSEEIAEVIGGLQADDGLVSEWMAEFSKLKNHFVGELNELDTARVLESKDLFRSLVNKVGAQL